MTITKIYYSTIKGSLQPRKKNKKVTHHKSHNAYTTIAKSSATVNYISKNKPKSKMLNKISLYIVTPNSFQQTLNNKRLVKYRAPSVEDSVEINKAP